MDICNRKEPQGKLLSYSQHPNEAKQDTSENFNVQTSLSQT